MKEFMGVRLFPLGSSYMPLPGFFQLYVIVLTKHRPDVLPPSPTLLRRLRQRLHFQIPPIERRRLRYAVRGQESQGQ